MNKESTNQKSHRDHWLLIAVLFFSFALNIHCLACESIWVDEGATIVAARGETTNIIPVLIEVIDNNPPGTYLLLHYWITLTGLSEFALRALSTLVALFSVAVLYRLARILFDNRTGLLSAVLLASSGFHIYYAQTVRSNVLLELFALLSFTFFARLMTHPTLLNRVLYILIGVLFLYTHYYAVFIFLAHTLFWTIRSWQISSNRFWDKLFYWFSTQSLIGIAFLPWVPMMIFQGRRAVTEIQPPSFASLVGTFLEFTWSPIGFVLALGLAGVGLYTVIRPLALRWLANVNVVSKNYSQFQLQIRVLPASFWLTVIWQLSVIAIPLLISYFFKPIFLSRYAIAALPAFYLSLSWLAGRVVKQPIGLLLAGALITAQLMGVSALYQSTNNEQWRDAVEYIDKQAETGDLLLFYSGIGKYSYDFYSQRNDLFKSQLGLIDGPARAQQAIQTVPAKTIWLILVYHSPIGFETTLQSHGYTLVEQRDFFRINIVRYQK